jgi:hypothetical protein
MSRLAPDNCGTREVPLTSLRRVAGEHVPELRLASQMRTCGAEHVEARPGENLLQCYCKIDALTIFVVNAAGQ